MPAWFDAAGALELAEGSFEEGADLRDSAQSQSAGLGVPVGGGRLGFHINRLYYLLIKARKKWCPKKERQRNRDKPSLASEFQGNSTSNYPLNQPEEWVIRNCRPVTTLARKLEDTAHVSGLAIRLARRSGTGDRLPEWLLKVAVERGAAHYRRDFHPPLPPDNPTIPDEEIGIALCLGQHPYKLDNVRVAAQLLSSPRVDAGGLCRLGIQGRCRSEAHT